MVTEHITKEQMAKLHRVIPFRWRTGSWIWKKFDQWGRTLYEKYRVLAYIDSRDVMDLLDEVFWPNRERLHKEINWTMYCGIRVQWIEKRDVGTKSNIEKEKGESSDSFKRSAVNRGIGRFLYTVPSFTITRAEAQKYQYNMTKYVREKFKSELQVRYDTNKVKQEDLQSKYEEEINEDIQDIPKTIEDVVNHQDRE